jgi:hypothetical protein
LILTVTKLYTLALDIIFEHDIIEASTPENSMIQNWSTIEKIACEIRTMRAVAATCKKYGNKIKAKAYELSARKWEKLLAKFADSCLMVEDYAIQLNYIRKGRQCKTYWTVAAICPDAAKDIADNLARACGYTVLAVEAISVC